MLAAPHDKMMKPAADRDTGFAVCYLTSKHRNSEIILGAPYAYAGNGL